MAHTVATTNNITSQPPATAVAQDPNGSRAIVTAMEFSCFHTGRDAGETPTDENSTLLLHEEMTPAISDVEGMTSGGPDAKGVKARLGVSLALCLLTAVFAAAASGPVTRAMVILVYICLQVDTAWVAYCVRDWGQVKRWLTGFVCVMILSTFKTAILARSVLSRMAGGGDSHIILGANIVFYGVTALWECSNASLVFGGRAMLGRFGITTYKRALLAGLAPCQVKFVHCDNEEERVRCSRRINKRSLHLFMFILGGVFLRQIFRSKAPGAAALVNLLKRSQTLEAEALAVLTSAFVVAVFDAFPHLWQVAVNCIFRYGVRCNENDADCNNTKVEAILPFGAVYLCISTRDFWSKWSRPSTQLIRQMVYYPLGGPRRPYFSIPLLFLINGACHYDVGYALVGDREENSWNIVFGILGSAATCEVLATNAMEARQGHYGTVSNTLPLWFRFVRGIAAHLSIRVALYVFVHRCLKTDLWSLYGI